MASGTIKDSNTVRTTTVSMEGFNGKATLARSGNVVMLSQGNAITSLVAGTNVKVGTIPDGYKPMVSVTASIFRGETALNNVRVQINYNGDILLYNYGSAISSAANGYIFMTWITQDV